MPTPDADVIQQLVAPAVLTPACGLLLLSSTARLNTVLARIRAFHRERLEVWRDEAAPGTRADRVRRLRLDGLESQTRRLLQRAALLRATMLVLFAAVACFLTTVLILGVGVAVVSLASALETATVAVFLVGVALFIAAMGTSAVEVWWVLATVRYENRRVEALCATDPGPDDAVGRGAFATDMGEGTAL